MSSRKGSFSGPDTRKIGKSPYASRPTITLPTPKPKHIIRDSSKKMLTKQLKPKTREEQQENSPGRIDIQDKQELSNLESENSEKSQEEREDIVAQSEDGNSKVEEPSPGVPEDFKEIMTDDREHSGIQSQTKNKEETVYDIEESTKEHNITTSGVTLKSLTLSSKENTPKNIEFKLKDPISSEICTYHEGETFIMFCNDCKSSVCSECIRTDHKEHEWIQLRKAGKIMRQKLAKYRKDIVKTHLPNFQTCLQKSRTEKEKVSKQRKKKMEEIIAQRDKMVAKVSELSQAMLSSCEEDLRKNEDTVQTMEKDIAELEVVASKLEESTLQCASDVETIQMETRLSSILNKIVPNDVPFKGNVDFIPGEINMDQIQIMIGKLTGLENDDAKQADDTPTDQDVSMVSSRSPRRPLRPLNDFQKCVQCKRMVKNVVKVKYMCGHKICNYCWFSTMNSTRCPHCNSL